jgi:hypothetical protein
MDPMFHVNLWLLGMTICVDIFSMIGRFQADPYDVVGTNFDRTGAYLAKPVHSRFRENAPCYGTL